MGIAVMWQRQYLSSVLLWEGQHSGCKWGAQWPFHYSQFFVTRQAELFVRRNNGCTLTNYEDRAGHWQKPLQLCWESYYGTIPHPLSSANDAALVYLSPKCLCTLFPLGTKSSSQMGLQSTNFLAIISLLMHTRLQISLESNRIGSEEDGSSWQVFCPFLIGMHIWI